MDPPAVLARFLRPRTVELAGQHTVGVPAAAAWPSEGGLDAPPRGRAARSRLRHRQRLPQADRRPPGGAPAGARSLSHRGLTTKVHRALSGRACTGRPLSFRTAAWAYINASTRSVAAG